MASNSSLDYVLGGFQTLGSGLKEFGDKYENEWRPMSEHEESMFGLMKDDIQGYTELVRSGQLPPETAAKAVRAGVPLAAFAGQGPVGGDAGEPDAGWAKPYPSAPAQQSAAGGLAAPPPPPDLSGIGAGVGDPSRSYNQPAPRQAGGLKAPANVAEYRRFQQQYDNVLKPRLEMQRSEARAEAQRRAEDERFRRQLAAQNATAEQNQRDREQRGQFHAEDLKFKYDEMNSRQGQFETEISMKKDELNRQLASTQDENQRARLRAVVDRIQTVQDKLTALRNKSLQKMQGETLVDPVGHARTIQILQSEEDQLRREYSEIMGSQNSFTSVQGTQQTAPRTGPGAVYDTAQGVVDHARPPAGARPPATDPNTGLAEARDIDAQLAQAKAFLADPKNRDSEHYEAIERRVQMLEQKKKSRKKRR